MTHFMGKFMCVSISFRSFALIGFDSIISMPALRDRDICSSVVSPVTATIIGSLSYLPYAANFL